MKYEELKGEELMLAKRGVALRVCEICVNNVKSNKSIPESYKDDIIKSLEDPNGFFNESLDFESIIRLACNDWNRNKDNILTKGLNELEFWKSIVLSNSSSNNTPHEVANEVIDSAKERFGESWEDNLMGWI